MASFGLHNPFVETELPEHAVYPVSQTSDGGIDLDYTSLLLGKRYLIDSSTYEYVCSGERPHLSPMKRTLEFLHREGFVERVDLQGLIEANLDRLSTALDSLLEEPTLWLPAIREQWSVVKDEYGDFQRLYGAASKAQLNTSHFAVWHYLALKGDEGNQGELARLTGLIESKRRRLTPAETDELRGIARPLVGQILVNDLARSKFEAPILDWDDNQTYYERLYLPQWDLGDRETRLALEARKLFDCVIPNLRPRNIEQVVRFISNDRAVRSLRSELWRCIDSGEGVSDEWHRRLLTRVLNSEISTKNKMKKFKWLALLAGLVIPGSSLIEEAAIELSEYSVEAMVGRDGVRDYKWFYMLQEEVPADREN